MKKKAAKKATVPAVAPKKVRPRSGWLWERVRRYYAGGTVSPTLVAKRLGVDRAYACRILQSMTLKGYATRTAERGRYNIHETDQRPEF